MCGIAGLFFFREQKIAHHQLGRMVQRLRHRGPDAQGFFEGKQGAIGHRRLSIIDLSPAAAQPMCDESKRYAVALNGEIYNFRELRKRIAGDFSFFSNSDTEVILRLFQKERENAWSQFNGMFAIAILDDSTNEIFLARDHAGIKPIFYTADDEKVLFASEPQALLPELSSPEPDPEALSLYLQLGYFPAPYTPFKQIRKLPAGHCMKISSRGIDIRKYWELPDPPSESRPIPEDPENALEQLLLQSVERQMVSDVPVGAFLSGGIDSSLIVALMSRISGSRIRTFTAGFEGFGYYDERPAATKIAELFNTEHTDFSPSQSVEIVVPKLISIFGEPFADSSALPTLALAELTSKHVKVALSGTGGDEIFGGYRKYMAAHWSAGYVSLPSALRKTISKTAGLFPASRQSLWRERALLFQRFTGMESELPAGLQLNRIFTKEEVKQITGQEVLPVEKLWNPVPGTMVENMMLFDYHFYLPEDLLVKEDRTTMAFGLEARVPFLDRELIEFMHRLPLRYKVSRTATKKIFRKVASRYLPDWVLKRPKHGFGSPASEWLRKELLPLAEHAIFSCKLFEDTKLLREKWEEHQKGRSDQSRALWTAMMLGLWNQQLQS